MIIYSNFVFANYLYFDSQISVIYDFWILEVDLCIINVIFIYRKSITGQCFILWLYLYFYQLFVNLQDSDIQISKSMRRADSMYQMDVEVTALFIDLHKCQNVSNLLVEKLDPTVTVCLPEFFHSSVTLQNLRLVPSTFRKNFW